MAIIDWAKEAASITDTAGLFDSLASVLDVKPVTGKKSPIEKDNSGEDDQAKIYNALFDKLFNPETTISIEYAEYNAYDRHLSKKGIQSIEKKSILVVS